MSQNMPDPSKARSFVSDELLVFFRTEYEKDVVAAIEPYLTSNSMIFNRDNTRAHRFPQDKLISSIKIRSSSPMKDMDLIKLVQDLDLLTESNRSNKATPVKGLLAVTPNWRIAATQPPGSGVGGPGAYPVVNAGSSNYKFTFRTEDGSVLWANSENCEHPVNVAILDAFPATKEEIQKDKELVKNPLWKSLDPIFTIAAEDINARNDLNNFPVTHPDHDYDMRSHGLFVAGIIHSIAPKAKITGYRVLNDNGIGSIDGILNTLYKVLETYENIKVPLIINMSLTMSLPYPQYANKHPDWFSGWPDFRAAITRKINATAALKQSKKTSAAASPIPYDLNEPIPTNIFERMLLPLTVIKQSLRYHEDTLIVAAAGNEGGNGVVSPPAMYPAAYEDVIGVAALDSWDRSPVVRLSPYSCIADAPPFHGFAVYGGNISANRPARRPESFRADEQLGILGLWLGKMPNADDPDTPLSEPTDGWVRWAGTSFAAPIITGTLAMLICLNAAPFTALGELRGKWDETTIPPGQDIPDVVLVEQDRA